MYSFINAVTENLAAFNDFLTADERKIEMAEGRGGNIGMERFNFQCSAWFSPVLHCSGIFICRFSSLLLLIEPPDGENAPPGADRAVNAADQKGPA